ncbi:hypothetical protein [Chitinophaga sancti]|uniref:Lipoprotein n=1 Tax=Chitinophaga sancti TaxID=1004 RepID=A0A1K1R347_9BACT|nr:hypothetical protein [Chitinophaga sancti]WQD64368.1 hypothetical protein U0033_08165 [Chitinophaga sancti]WQG90008.1 hypothetical protein SR876_00755 [Chitinophaga sancti]SFW66006.1 hypothetical protein SAMN05661012_03272 [Chitinophaga sancti]
MPKAKFLLLAAMITCLIATGCGSSCTKTTTISTGQLSSHFDGNWKYENKELGFSLNLPNEWFLQTSLGRIQYYVPLSKNAPEDMVRQKTLSLEDAQANKGALFTVRDVMPEEGAGAAISFVLTDPQAKGEENTDLKIGSETLKGASAKTSRGTNTITVFKNYGCFDLKIFAEYTTPEQLAKIKALLASAKL